MSTPLRKTTIEFDPEKEAAVEAILGTKGLKAGLVGVDVAMVMRLPLARAWFQLGWECISGDAVGVDLASGRCLILINL